MFQFISSFTQISIIKEELATVQRHIDYLARELAKKCSKPSSDGCSIEDAYYVCIQERYNKAAERKQKLHEKYIALCNLTHREIDRIEDKVKNVLATYHTFEKRYGCSFIFVTPETFPTFVYETLRRYIMDDLYGKCRAKRLTVA